MKYIYIFFTYSMEHLNQNKAKSTIPSDSPGCGGINTFNLFNKFYIQNPIITFFFCKTHNLS